jgi:hypothetical protein
VGDFIDDVRDLIGDILRSVRAELGSFRDESSRSIFNQYFRSVESQLVGLLGILNTHLDGYYRGINRLELRDELLMGARLQQQAAMLMTYVLELTYGILDRCSRIQEPSVSYPDTSESE